MWTVGRDAASRSMNSCPVRAPMLSSCRELLGGHRFALAAPLESAVDARTCAPD
jgi:hypothetical protein